MDATYLLRSDWSYRLYSVIFSFLAGFVVFYFLSVLFGGKLVSSPSAVWAVVQSAFCAVPLSFHFYDPPRHDKSRSTLLGKQYEALLVPAVSSVLGSYFGCCVIPLDWNEPWQTWPIPGIAGCVIGALLGWAWVLAKMLSSRYETRL